MEEVMAVVDTMAEGTLVAVAIGVEVTPVSTVTEVTAITAATCGPTTGLVIGILITRTSATTLITGTTGLLTLAIKVRAPTLSWPVRDKTSLRL